MMYTDVKQAIGEIIQRMVAVETDLKSWSKLFRAVPVLVTIILLILGFVGWNKVSDVEESLRSKVDDRIALLDSMIVDISERARSIDASLDRLQRVNQLRSEYLSAAFDTLHYNELVTGKPSLYAKCDSVIDRYNDVFALHGIRSGDTMFTDRQVDINVVVDSLIEIAEGSYFHVAIIMSFEDGFNLARVKNREIFTVSPGLNKVYVTTPSRSGEYVLEVALLGPESQNSSVCEKYATVIPLNIWR